MTVKKYTKHNLLSKKKIILIVLLCIIFIIPGCTGNNSESKDTPQSNTELNEQSASQNETELNENTITQTEIESGFNQQLASQNEPNDTIEDITQDSISLEILVEKANENLSASFTIGMIGDVLFHEWLIAGGLQEDGSYYYPYIYEYLEPDINNLDFAMFNMEGTLAGPPYVGYPIFPHRQNWQIPWQKKDLIWLPLQVIIASIAVLKGCTLQLKHYVVPDWKISEHEKKVILHIFLQN